jgi:hypothetical protein
MSGGAGLLVFSVGWWGFGAGVTELIPSWTGFLVLTVAGERLELARLFGLSRVAKTTFQIAMALVLLSAFIATWNLAISEPLLGAGLVALSLWLGQYDIVRHQDRGFGLIRFVNTALLLGYGWMFLGGCLWLIYGGPLGGLFYDAALHRIFVGFVFSMVFAHAPLVFPAVTGLSLPFHRGLFLPFLFLDASLALRIVGGLSGNSPIRQWGGLLSVGSIILFFILLQLGRIYTKKTP